MIDYVGNDFITKLLNTRERHRRIFADCTFNFLTPNRRTHAVLTGDFSMPEQTTMQKDFDKEFNDLIKAVNEEKDSLALNRLIQFVSEFSTELVDAREELSHRRAEDAGRYEVWGNDVVENEKILNGSLVEIMITSIDLAKIVRDSDAFRNELDFLIKGLKLLPGEAAVQSKKVD